MCFVIRIDQLARGRNRTLDYRITQQDHEWLVPGMHPGIAYRIAKAFQLILPDIMDRGKIRQFLENLYNRTGGRVEDIKSFTDEEVMELAGNLTGGVPTATWTPWPTATATATPTAPPTARWP